MDHFNVTVQRDGAVVATRRGLQVSKQKYHGISFVNASCPQQPPTTTTASSSARPWSGSDSTGKPQQQQRQWKFVNKEKKDGPAKTRQLPGRPKKNKAGKREAASQTRQATGDGDGEREREQEGRGEGEEGGVDREDGDATTAAVAYRPSSSNSSNSNSSDGTNGTTTSSSNPEFLHGHGAAVAPGLAGLQAAADGQGAEAVPRLLRAGAAQAVPVRGLVDVQPSRSRDFCWMVVQDPRGAALRADVQLDDQRRAGRPRRSRRPGLPQSRACATWSTAS